MLKSKESFEHIKESFHERNTIPYIQRRTDARVKNRLSHKDRRLDSDLQPLAEETEEMIVTSLAGDAKFDVMPIAFKNRITELFWWFDLYS